MIISELNMLFNSTDINAFPYNFCYLAAFLQMPMIFSTIQKSLCSVAVPQTICLSVCLFASQSFCLSIYYLLSAILSDQFFFKFLQLSGASFYGKTCYPTQGCKEAKSQCKAGVEDCKTYCCNSDLCNKGVGVPLISGLLLLTSVILGLFGI